MVQLRQNADVAKLDELGFRQVRQVAVSNQLERVRDWLESQPSGVSPAHMEDFEVSRGAKLLRVLFAERAEFACRRESSFAPVQTVATATTTAQRLLCSARGGN